MQPAMAIDMAVRALEKKLEIKDIAPNSFIIDKESTGARASAQTRRHLLSQTTSRAPTRVTMDLSG
ncbi:hypothetical protein B5M44_24760 [Shinella sumterensis]|nr:hypothetical protein B5M44_24760 [Shinella sumterensis]